MNTTVPARTADDGLVALLAGRQAPAGLAEHRASFGPLPVFQGRDGARRLVELVTEAGLRGRGGAGFPTGRKLAAVAAGGRQAVVLANGCESEPASQKDRLLLTRAPHLVLDGAALAATAVGARRVIICVPGGGQREAIVRAAIGQRTEPLRWEVATPPHRYTASEESALVNFVNNGDGRPMSVPPRPYQRGVAGRPTLVDNVETLAHLALVASRGAAWFRAAGTDTDPGTSLVTVTGAVADPGVYEVALGTPLGALLDLAGGPAQPLSAVLVGGYFGTWVAMPEAAALPLSHDPAGTDATTLGAGVLVALPAAACGLAETARAAIFLADQSAGQCGPCQFGLPAVAGQLRDLALGYESQGSTRRRPPPDEYPRLTGRLAVISGRGACRHPDGAVRLIGSALRVFAEDVRAHLAGRPCPGLWYPPVLPVPAATRGYRSIL